MTSLRHRMLVTAALGLAAICASAVPASAQAAKGGFTLPNEVRWQGWTFPAGDYTFRMDSVAKPNRIILNGPNGYESVSTIVADQDARDGQSSLTIVHRGSKAFVQDLYLAPIGLRLKYEIPKATKEELLAQGAVTTEHILVAIK